MYRIMEKGILSSGCACFAYVARFEGSFLLKCSGCMEELFDSIR